MTARKPRSPEITDAERRVLNLLPDGLNSGQIATRLHLAESTVKSHLVAISERWGVHGRPAILVEAYRRGELPLPDGPELRVLRERLAADTRAWTPDPDDRVEWNPTTDVWKPATVERIMISRTGTVVRIVLDENGQPLLVGLEHLRPSPAVPAVEQAEPAEPNGGQS